MGFSPDGKWLLAHVYGINSVTGNDKEYRLTIPVTSEIPETTGKPIELLSPGEEKFPDWPRDEAWTQNLVSFVTANGVHLLQWDLDVLKDAQWTRPKH